MCAAVRFIVLGAKVEIFTEKEQLFKLLSLLGTSQLIDIGTAA